MVPLIGEGCCGLGGASRDSAGLGAMEEVLISWGGKNLRLPLRFGLRPQGPCRVGTGESGLVLSEEVNPACLSSCSGGHRPLVELCVEPRVFPADARGCHCRLGLCLHPQGCLRRGYVIGFFSRADRGIGVVRRVAPPTWLISNVLVRLASSLGAPGRPGTPSRPRRGIDSPVAIRRGEEAQMKRCRDPRCSPRGNQASRGTFGVA